MSLLNNIINEASKLQTKRITLKEGKRPVFTTIHGTVEPRGFETLTPADVNKFFSSIFVGKHDLSHHQRRSRRFKVLDIGELDCIGLPDLRQVNLYFVEGESFYEEDCEIFLSEQGGVKKQTKVEETDSAEQVNQQEKDLIASDDNSSFSLSDILANLQTDTDKNTPPPSTLQPQGGAPLPAPQQSSKPDDAGDDTPRLELPSLNDSPPPVPLPDTSEQKNETPPEREGMDVFQPPVPSASPSAEDSAGVYQPAAPSESPSPAREDALSALFPKQDSTVAPDVGEESQAQHEDTAVQEETGVHTAMPKKLASLDQAVIKSDAITEDNKSQSAVPTVMQAAVEQQTSAAHALTGTSNATTSDGSHAIDKLLREMMEKKASDLHLSCDHPVMMRIGGQMEKVNADDKITAEALQNWLNPIIPAADAARLARSGDVDFTYELKDAGRFRVNVLKDLHGLGAVLRYVPASLRTLEELGAPEIVKKFCYLSKGLVIINGPAGSGRSTTLAAMIDVINTTRKAHLLSIEDPIEFVHAQKNSLIRQREVGTHTSSVQEGLRAALREDPDIICTDELREVTALLMAMKCAEAGRLVFSMMHTRNSVSAIDSIINQFTPSHQTQARHLLANTLRGVICQTLVRKKDGAQVAAWEVLIVSDEAAAIIKTGRIQQITAHMIAHRVKGNILLNDSLLKLVNEETVNFNNALIAAVDRRAFQALAQRRGVKLSA